MMTVARAFDRLDDGLKLDSAEVQAAKQCHHAIRDLLAAAGLIVGAFLQGSLARKTMVAPLRDVDMVVLIAPAHGHLRYAQGGSIEVMRLIHAALAAAYPEATFKVAKHALQLDLGEGHFSFDVVPAFECDDNTTDVEIADTSTGGWKRSNTRTLIEVVARRNQQCNGRFVHQVRMGKYFVNCHLAGAICGLVTESLALDSITRALPHAEACAALLRAFATRLGGSIPDPTRHDDLARKLDPGVVERARPVLTAAAERAEEARRLEQAGDDRSAIAIWHDLFGAPFPTPATMSEAEAAAAWSGGAVTSAGTVSSTALGRQPARPTRAVAARGRTRGLPGDPAPAPGL